MRHEDTYKINCSKASMANLSEICEELFWIFFEEELCNFGVLQAARSAGWWHPAGQWADRLSGYKVLPQPLVHLYEWSLFSMDYCKKKIAILHWLSSAQRPTNKAAEEQLSLLPKHAGPLHEAGQPIHWDGKIPLRQQWSISAEHNSKPKHKMRCISSPSTCPITCREVSSVALPHTDTSLSPGSPITPSASPWTATHATSPTTGWTFQSRAACSYTIRNAQNLLCSHRAFAFTTEDVPWNPSIKQEYFQVVSKSSHFSTPGEATQTTQAEHVGVCPMGRTWVLGCPRSSQQIVSC